MSMKHSFKRLRWRLKSRRCTCGEMRLAPGTTCERGGIKHRTDGPCYHTYGNPERRVNRR